MQPWASRVHPRRRCEDAVGAEQDRVSGLGQGELLPALAGGCCLGRCGVGTTPLPTPRKVTSWAADVVRFAGPSRGCSHMVTGDDGWPPQKLPHALSLNGRNGRARCAKRDCDSAPGRADRERDGDCATRHDTDPLYGVVGTSNESAGPCAARPVPESRPGRQPGDGKGAQPWRRRGREDSYVGRCGAGHEGSVGSPPLLDPTARRQRVEYGAQDLFAQEGP